MKKILILLLFIFLISACSSVEDVEPKMLWGNGICEDLEFKNKMCVEDCNDVGQGKLYLGFMIHIEGWDDAIDNEMQFNRWAELTRETADILEEYNAIGTFEFSPEFVEASEKWGDNVILEMYERGHGVGVHADLGFQAEKKGYTQEQFVADLIEQKEDIERVFGHEVRHVSGICSELDWVQAAIDAGFEFTTGGVSMCLQSLPEDKRPKEYLSDSIILKNYHDIYPNEVKDIVHPWRVSTARDWLVNDPDGDLVIFSSDGVIEGFYEQRVSGDFGREKAVFDENDVSLYIDILDEYLEYSRNDRINLYYVAESIGNSMDEEVTKDWLEAIEPYVEDGRVEWKSFPDVYDEYVEMESS
ncbi:MAG: hypothetical protein ABIJ18_02720 [archaeon]